MIEEDKLVENAAEMGAYAIKRLTEIGQSCPFVSAVWKPWAHCGPQ